MSHEEYVPTYPVYTPRTINPHPKPTPKPPMTKPKPHSIFEDAIARFNKPKARQLKEIMTDLEHTRKYELHFAKLTSPFLPIIKHHLLPDFIEKPLAVMLIRNKARTSPKLAFYNHDKKQLDIAPLKHDMINTHKVVATIHMDDHEGNDLQDVREIKRRIWIGVFNNKFACHWEHGDLFPFLRAFDREH